MADGFFLTPEDKSLLEDLLRRERQRRKGRGVGSLYDLDDLPAPEMYVALTPSGGIPGCTEPRTTTGTGFTNPQPIHTGSGIGNEGDTPGSAECDIYRLIPSKSGAKQLHPTGLTKIVYNAGPTPINGSQFVTIFRDKYGEWYVPLLGLLFTECD